MSAISRLLPCLLLVLGLSGEAHARFGKASREEAREEQVHHATPHGEQHAREERRARRRQRRWARRHVLTPVPVFTTVHVHGVAPVVYGAGAAAGPQEGGHGGGGLHVAVGMDVHPVREGAGVGLEGLIEGERLGFMLRAEGYGLRSQDQAGGTDTLGLLELAPSYALVAEPGMRLRARAGLTAASAPDVDFYGLGLGLNFVMCLVGPVDLEADVGLTPFPYGRLTGQAGVALALGPLVARAGVRSVYLDDYGWVDGVAHTDHLLGPYLGVGLQF